MPRRFITVEDIQRVQGRELAVDEETIVTPQAREAAAAAGIVLRTARGDYEEPQPDRGPDAARAMTHLPHLPEPEATPGQLSGAVATVVGLNRPGVLAEVTATLAELGINIGDIAQKIVQDYFHLVLILDIPPGVGFEQVKTALECLGHPEDYAVRVMHERVFRFMHRV